MKLRLLDYLVCPECHRPFRCQSQEERDGEVETGTLECTGCGKVYAITRSIPRLVGPGLAADKERTADAFGWEWQEFSELHDDW